MGETIVINKHHGNVPADAVYIGRGSPWGNPFSHMEGTTAFYKVNTREEAIEAYKHWFLRQTDLFLRLKELRGKTLVCYCSPKSCHGDILIYFIESGIC